MPSRTTIVVRASFAALAIAASTAIAPAQTINLLADPAQWSSWGGSGTGSMSLLPGVVRYQNTDYSADSFAAVYNNTVTLPTNRDWSLQTNTLIGGFSEMVYGHYVDLSLVVAPVGADPEATHIAYTYEYGIWSGGPSRSINVDAVLDGVGLSTGIDREGAMGSYIGLKLDYAASTQLLTFSFARYSGAPWQAMHPDGLFSLRTPGSDFGLGASDQFLIALVGSSNGIPLSVTPAMFLNASATISDAPVSAAVPEPSTYGLAGLAVLALAIIRRRLRR